MQFRSMMLELMRPVYVCQITAIVVRQVVWGLAAADGGAIHRKPQRHWRAWIACVMATSREVSGRKFCSNTDLSTTNAICCGVERGPPQRHAGMWLGNQWRNRCYGVHLRRLVDNCSRMIISYLCHSLFVLEVTPSSADCSACSLIVSIVPSIIQETAGLERKTGICTAICCFNGRAKRGSQSDLSVPGRICYFRCWTQSSV
jgi:hypothetical protein